VTSLRPAAEPEVAPLLEAYAAEVRERFDGGPACCSLDPLVDDDVELFALCHDGRLVGCAGLRPLGDGAAELKRMYVAPAARGHGHGRRLLAEIEAAARERGYTRLRLDTGEPMPEAQALYRSAGFREIPDYNGNAAAAFWFEKELAPEAAPAWKVWGALSIVYVVWGATYLGIRVVVETIPPMLSAGARFLVAGAAFWLFLRVRRGAAAVRITRPQFLAAAATGALLLLGGNGLVTLAERDIPSALAALIIASVPLWVVLFRFISGERPTTLTLLGVAIGFVGVAILMLPGERPEGATVGGFVLLLLAAASWATGSYYSRGWPLPRDAFVSTSWQMIIGGVVMLAIALVAGEFNGFSPADVSGRSLAGWLFLVGAGSLMAFTAYVWLLQNAPISKVATYAYVNPMVAIFLGWALLSEEITATIIAGASLIVASVALVVTRETT
jgi:drug/metabolite transporter (DMT)-like permease/GNAT superfamily N-acetyltransferase